MSLLSVFCFVGKNLKLVCPSHAWPNFEQGYGLFLPLHLYFVAYSHRSHSSPCPTFLSLPFICTQHIPQLLCLPFHFLCLCLFCSCTDPVLTLHFQPIRLSLSALAIQRTSFTQPSPGA